MKFTWYDKEEGLKKQLKTGFWKMVIAFLVALGFVAIGAM